MSDDVLITPASRKIEFKDSGGNIDGTIQLDSSGNLVLTSSVGLLIGDLDADIHIGDGSNVVDMVFDFAGSIYSAANQNLTIGKKSLGGNDILIESPSPVRVSTASGYIDVGPANSGYAHMQTDRTRFYFNKPLIIDGGNTSGDAYLVSSYSTEDFVIATNNGAEDRITIKQATGNVGIGTTSPGTKLEVEGSMTVNGHINFDTQHVGGSAGGSTGTENGANTWCKVLSWDPGTTQYRDLSLTLGFTEVDVGSQNQAIINVYGRSNGTNSAHTMGIKIISLTSALHLQDDSFKLITEGWGQPIELWMKKYGSYGTFNWNEIAKKLGGSTTLTYFSNSAWQSAEPAKTNGTPAAVRSFGTVIEGRQAVLNLYHNQNVSQLSANDVLSTISFRKHTGHAGNETIRIYNVHGNSGTSDGVTDDYHTSDLRISTRKIGTSSMTDRFTILGQEGNVGIGTMSPTFASGSGLHIYDSTQANLRLEDAAGEFFDVAMQNGDAYLINRVSDGFISFRTNSIERFKIDSEGANTMYRNDSTTQNALLKLHEDSVYADNPTLEVLTDRTDGAIPSISVVGGAVTVSGPNGWNTWEKETFYKHSYGTATGQGSGLINASHNGVGTINSFTLPYDAKLRAVAITYTFNTSTSSTADQTWRLFHSGNPANVVSNFTFDVDNDMTNTHGNFFLYVSSGLDVDMGKNKTYSVRRESGTLNIQSAVRFDLWYTRHTGNF